MSPPPRSGHAVLAAMCGSRRKTPGAAPPRARGLVAFVAGLAAGPPIAGAPTCWKGWCSPAKLD